MSELKDAYNKIEGLPPFEEFDSKFMFHDYCLNFNRVPTQFIFAVKRCCIDFIWSYINVLHGWLVPNPQSLIMMKEAEMVDKEKVQKLMIDMVALVKLGATLQKNSQSKDMISYINKVHKEWDSLIDRYVEISKDISDKWTGN